VRCYTELASGPLEDEQLLSWPDMLVLTGLTNSFDRMLHLTAYARTKNPKVIVVAGGPSVRSLPLTSERVFDYACLGDIEELCDVIKEALGPEYVAETMIPRYDLAYWLDALVTSRPPAIATSVVRSVADSGRSCLPNLRSRLHSPADSGVRQAQSHVFLDNNFYGSDRNHFKRS